MSRRGNTAQISTRNTSGISPTFSTRRGHDPRSRSKWTSWLKGLHYSSDVLFLFQELSARADARWWLGRQRELELFEQDFLIGFWMGVAAQNQSAAVGRWEVHIEHLDAGKLVQNGTWGQPGASGRNRARKVTCRQ
jgi:hypothetical protein